MFDLTGKTALVTGAGQGVGAGIARRLAQAGANVFINDLIGERAEAAATGIENAEPLPFDVTDYDAVKSALQNLENLGAKTKQRKGESGIDILVNNAGIPKNMGMEKFKDTTPENWRPYIDINLYGVMSCSHCVLAGMAERGWGRIITISSGAGTVGLNTGVSAYAAGKGGGISFMRHLALESAKDGITANTVALGLMNTIGDSAPESGTENTPELSEIIAKMAKAIPTGRLGTPDDVGAICVYLASPEADWITGQTIQLNGGTVTT